MGSPSGNRKRRWRRRHLVELAVAATALLVVASAGAWVDTDQDDYTPGSVVTISGGNDGNGAPGYVEGSTVDVAVSGPNGWTSSCSATAATGGSWECTVTLDSDPAVAVGDYSYTATSTSAEGGEISESGTFTDAVQTQTTVTSSLNPSNVGDSVTFTATVKSATGAPPAFTVTVTAGQVKFGTGANCEGDFSELQAAATVNGSGQVTYTTTALAAGTTVIRACYLGSGSGASALGTSNGTVSQVVNSAPAGPTKLAFTTTAFTQPVFACFGPITVQTQNASSVATNVTADTTVNLTTDNGTTGNGAFYSDSGCTTAVTSRMITTGNSDASFYYKATNRGDGTHEITAAASGLTSASQTQTITRATPTFTFDLSTLPAKTYGNGTFSVVSYVSSPDSPGTVTFATAAGSIGCTVSTDGATVTLTGAATDANKCKITATLAETDNWLGASDTEEFGIAKATTSLLVNAIYDNDGNTSVTVSATLSVSPTGAGKCVYVTPSGPGRTVLFALDGDDVDTDFDDGFEDGTTTGSGGAVSAAISTIVPGTVYDVEASYIGVDVNGDSQIDCTDATEYGTATVTSPGDAANGGGWYKLPSGRPGSPRVNFGFTVRKMKDGTYKGQLLVHNNELWRVKGDLNAGFGTFQTNCLTVTVCGSASGSGKLYRWESDQWVFRADVTYVITFGDGGSSKKGGAKPDLAGLTSLAGYAPQGGEVLPTSAWQTLMGGNVTLTATK